MLRNTGRPAASNSIESRSENTSRNRKMVPPKIARTEMRTRHLDAGLARSLALERTPTRRRAANGVLRFAHPRWQSLRNFCVQGSPKFSGDSVIFSGELGAKFA